MFSVPALIEMFAAHGFVYEGFTSSDHFRGNEQHRFTRRSVSFLFGFAYSIYGEDFIGIEVPEPSGTGARTSVHLSYFVDYALERNALRESGLTHDESLAQSLAPHIEYVTQLAGISTSHGRVIPLKADRTELANARFEP